MAAELWGGSQGRRKWYFNRFLKCVAKCFVSEITNFASVSQGMRGTNPKIIYDELTGS